jgi:hypothetical protein
MRRRSGCVISRGAAPEGPGGGVRGAVRRFLFVCQGEISGPSLVAHGLWVQGLLVIAAAPVLGFNLLAAVDEMRSTPSPRSFDGSPGKIPGRYFT